MIEIWLALWKSSHCAIFCLEWNIGQQRCMILVEQCFGSQALCHHRSSLARRMPKHIFIACSYPYIFLALFIWNTTTGVCRDLKIDDFSVGNTHSEVGNVSPLISHLLLI